MNKAKSVCRQIFLYLLFAISAAVTVCSAILFGKANGAVSTKEFIDTAADSVDSAYALIEKRDMYAGMLKISIAACIVTALMIALWHVIHRIIKKKKSAASKAMTRVTNSAMSTIGRELGRSIIRGIFGSIK